VCSRNTTAVDNATEVVEIRVSIDRASLQSTEIVVPGYRLVIDIPEDEGSDPFGGMNPFGEMGGESLGVGGVILGNMAAMLLLVGLCGLIGALVSHKNKEKIDEFHGMVENGLEVAGYGGPRGDGSDEDEEALQMSETGDGFGLSAGGALQKAGMMKKAKKGNKVAVLSMFTGAVSTVMADPRAQEMAHHMQDDLEAKTGHKVMNPMDKGSKIVNPMRDSVHAAADSPLAQGLLSSGAELGHGAVDKVASSPRVKDSAVTKAATAQAHKVLDAASPDAPKGKKKAGKNKNKQENPMAKLAVEQAQKALDGAASSAGIDAPKGKKRGKK